MSEEAIVGATVVAVVLGCGYFMKQCNDSDNELRKVRHNALVECVRAGSDPLVCEKAMP